MLAVMVVAGVLAVFAYSACRVVYVRSSLAVSANNLRLLSAATAHYLTENNFKFWKFRNDSREGTVFWFGYEGVASLYHGVEGKRSVDFTRGPLGPYVPAGIRPDPSFSLAGSAFKPKYKNGYIGIGYNGVLGGGFGKREPLSYWELGDPARVVVFATSAQVNTFQSPASGTNPMLEEFYLIDQRETTVHFRHGGLAMVAFANGSAGFLPMDPGTRDGRMPDGNVGRFAPVGSFDYLR
jgi:hypothetical protein